MAKIRIFNVVISEYWGVIKIRTEIKQGIELIQMTVMRMFGKKVLIKTLERNYAVLAKDLEKGNLILKPLDSLTLGEVHILSQAILESDLKQKLISDKRAHLIDDVPVILGLYHFSF